MDKEFNKKNMHQHTLNAIQTMEHNVKENLMEHINVMVTKVASSEFLFEVVIDIRKELDDLAINLKANLNEEQKAEIIKDVVVILKAKEFDVEELKKDKIEKLKISWK